MEIKNNGQLPKLRNMHALPTTVIGTSFVYSTVITGIILRNVYSLIVKSKSSYDIGGLTNTLEIDEKGIKPEYSHLNQNQI